MATLICVVDYQCSATTLSVWEKVCATLHDSWNSIGPYKVNAPIGSILMKPSDMNSLTLLDALCPIRYKIYMIMFIQQV